jgi:hypothetical protein
MIEKHHPPFVGEEGEMKLKDKPYVKRGFKYECLKYDNIAFMNMTLKHDNIEIYCIHEIFAIIIWVLHKKN